MYRFYVVLVCTMYMHYLYVLVIFLGRRRHPYIVFRNYVDVWLPVRSLVYIYIYLSKNGGRAASFRFIA